MKTRVVTISIDAEAAGEKLSVQEAVISLGVNAIPSVELICAPELGQPTPLKPEVRKPTISGFSELYQKLADKAEGLNETGNVTIEIEYDDGEKDGIKLTGWILASVGLSSVSATSAPYMSIVLQHKICKLTKVGSIYETPKTEMSGTFNEYLEKAEDFLDIVEKTYEYLRNFVKYEDPPPGTNPQIYRENLGLGEYDPKEYLEFKCDKDEQGIFLGKVDSESKVRIIQGIGRMVESSCLAGSSTWDMLVSSAGPTMLSVVQDQQNNFTTDKLIIEPTKPWKECTIILDEEMCSSTDLPGMDPFKIAGVMGRKHGAYGTLISLGLILNGNPLNEDKKPVYDVLYTPKGLDVSLANGRIMKIQIPSILESMLRRDGVYGKNMTEGLAKCINMIAKGYDDAILKYCQAVYEISVRSMVMSTVNMALRLHDDASYNLILPGNTCKLRSQGEDIYYGYINNVVHRLSVNGGNTTMVKMSHVRPKAPYYVNDEIAIAPNSPNAAYTE